MRKELVFAYLPAMDKRQISTREAVPKSCRLIQRHCAQILITAGLYLCCQKTMRRCGVMQQVLGAEEILKTSLVNILKGCFGIVLHHLLAHRADSLLFGGLMQCIARRNESSYGQDDELIHYSITTGLYFGTSAFITLHPIR